MPFLFLELIASMTCEKSAQVGVISQAISGTWAAGRKHGMRAVELRPPGHRKGTQVSTCPFLTPDRLFAIAFSQFCVLEV